MPKTYITTLARYAQNVIDTAIKLSHIFKYLHSIMKQTMSLDNIKKNNIFQMEFSDDNLKFLKELI